MTLVALSPAPTAVPSATVTANRSASATGFGALMTDANASLTAAAMLAVSAAAGPADSPGKDTAPKTADSAGDPVSAPATEQPAQGALPASVLPIAEPLVVPTMVPLVVPTMVPLVVPTMVPALAPPAARAMTDSSSTMSPASSAVPTAVAAGALAATVTVSADTAASSHASRLPVSTPPTSTPLSTSLFSPASVSPAVASFTASTLLEARTKPIAVTADALAGPIAASPARLEMIASPIAASAPLPTQNTPFAGQFARPIFTLATAGPGSHTMTISVTPDSLGPVVVRAHVGPEGIRVELFAPTDLGRDAIRAILPDLRKDLAGTGVGANLDLSSQNQPSEAGDRRGDGAPRSERSYVVPPRIVSDDDDNVAAAPRRILTASSIDVLA